jgi:DNA-binding NtrC family response regulator
VKLNRVLQENEIRRLGETRNRKIDVRIIAATLRDLRTQVDAGQFREDLYYRLNVFRIRAPSLRDPERREDIGPLIEHFLQKHAKLLRVRVPTFSPTAMRLMLNYPWPGNVRELEHAIERALVVAENGEITPEALPSELNGVQWSSTVSFDLSSMTYKQAIEVARDKMSQDYLRQLFARHQGNVSAATTDADIERESLYRLARRYGIDPAQFRNRNDGE